MRSILAVAAVSGVFIAILFGGGRLLDVWDAESRASSARPSSENGQVVQQGKRAPKPRAGKRAGDWMRPQLRFRPADQAAARAAVLQRGDFAPGSGWRGGPMKPDTSTISCVNFRPKRSDLVVTGRAGSSFSHAKGGVTFMSGAEVLRTRKMLELDWKRTVANRNFLACIRRVLAKEAFLAKETWDVPTRVVSLKRVRFPRLARFTAAFRLLLDVGGSRRRVRMMVDLVVIGGNRTELTFTAIAPYTSRTALVSAEKRGIRALLARLRA